MLRDGHLYGTAPASSAGTAQSSNMDHLVVICDEPRPAAPTVTAPSSSNQASAPLDRVCRYSPGRLEAIQVLFCLVALHHVLPECMCAEVNQTAQHKQLCVCCSYAAAPFTQHKSVVVSYSLVQAMLLKPHMGPSVHPVFCMHSSTC